MSSKQTSLDLNGPFLEFTTQPLDKSVCPGDSFSITAIASASFLDEPSGTPINPAVPTGTLSYQWYEVVGGSYILLSDNSVISGSKTSSLTFSNISESYRGKQYIVSVDYVPSAYSQPQGSAVTDVTARSTGNAINEVLYSNISTVNVRPTIIITQQPTTNVISDTQATFAIVANVSDGSSLSYQWYVNDAPAVDGGGTVGSKTSTFSYVNNTPGTYSVYCLLSSSTACNSSLKSSTSSFVVPPPPPTPPPPPPPSQNRTVYFEYISIFSKYFDPARLESFTFSPGGPSYTLNPQYSSTAGAQLVSFYTLQDDVNVEMDLYGSAGGIVPITNNRNGDIYVSDISEINNRGPAEGGYSRIKITLEPNTEYVIAPYRSDITDSRYAIFLYKKSKLIAAVGAGGTRWEPYIAGRGGGIGFAGENASTFIYGREGIGGSFIFTGGLPHNGIDGSFNNEPELCCGDTRAAEPAGGRVLPCPRGDLTYRSLYSPCSDIGYAQFRVADQPIAVYNTAFINRGFKSGYSLTNTSGAANGSENPALTGDTATYRARQKIIGGAGATGGSGGTITYISDKWAASLYSPGIYIVYGGGHSAGGGSGYAETGIEILQSTLGGNPGPARVIMRLYSPPPPPPPPPPRIPPPPPPPPAPPPPPSCRTQGERDLAYFIDEYGDQSGVTLGENAVNRARECGFTDCEIVNLARSQGKKFGTLAQASLNCSTESPSSCKPPGC